MKIHMFMGKIAENAASKSISLTLPSSRAWEDTSIMQDFNPNPAYPLIFSEVPGIRVVWDDSSIRVR